METFPIVDERRGQQAFAFEIDNAYISPSAIARLLAQVDGVTDIQVRTLFGKSRDVHVEFKYLNRGYVVWEPYGDNSRYWIGPKTPEKERGDIGNIQSVFQRYRPPLHMAVIGDILSLRWLKRLIGRS